jgi:hypothetical protein
LITDETKRPSPLPGEGHAAKLYVNRGKKSTMEKNVKRKYFTISEAKASFSDIPPHFRG